MDKRCGECRHWKGDRYDYDKPGHCGYPVPEWLISFVCSTNKADIMIDATARGYYSGQECATFQEFTG